MLFPHIYHQQCDIGNGCTAFLVPSFLPYKLQLVHLLHKIQRIIESRGKEIMDIKTF